MRKYRIHSIPILRHIATKDSYNILTSQTKEVIYFAATWNTLVRSCVAEGWRIFFKLLYCFASQDSV